MMKQFLEEAKRLIRINSVSSHGNEEISNYVAALMQDRSLKTQIQHVMHSSEDISKRQFNVIGVLGDPLVDKKIRKGLLLSTHLDTVSPGILEHWSETGGDPFAAVTKEGKIFGLGAADAKLDFLCKLHAVEKFREKKLKNPVYLVGTCGEEIGMFGVRYLIKSLALNPQYVLVGEPSDLSLIYAHKSLNIIRVTIGYQLIEKDARGFNRRIDLHSFGKSTHSAYPDQGINAIVGSVDFLHRAIESGFETRFTRLSGGDTANKVPDHALIQFYLTSHQFEDFKRFFREVVRAEGKEKSFRVELGGVGDIGVRFLPDHLFPCLTEVVRFFNHLSSDIQGKRDQSYDPPYSTINFGSLKQRMDSIDMYFDLRLLPDLGQDQVLESIQKGIQAIAAQFPSLNLSVVRERMNPGLNMNIEDQWVRTCKKVLSEVGIEPQVTKQSTTTEAAQYFEAGYPSVVFGASQSQANSHTPNEVNTLEQLEKAISFYEKVIEEVCL